MHRSQWEAEDFLQYPHELTRFRLGCGDYGVFWCAQDVPADARVDGLVLAAEVREKRGEPERALSFLVRAHELAPANECAVVPLVNLLLERGKHREAVERLRWTVEAEPKACWARLLLARVLSATCRHAEANEELRVLLEQADVPGDVGAAATDFKAAIQARFL